MKRFLHVVLTSASLFILTAGLALALTPGQKINTQKLKTQKFKTQAQVPKNLSAKPELRIAEIASVYDNTKAANGDYIVKVHIRNKSPKYVFKAGELFIEMYELPLGGGRKRICPPEPLQTQILPGRVGTFIKQLRRCACTVEYEVLLWDQQSQQITGHYKGHAGSLNRVDFANMTFNKNTRRWSADLRSGITTPVVVTAQYHRAGKNDYHGIFRQKMVITKGTALHVGGSHDDFKIGDTILIKTYYDEREDCHCDWSKVSLGQSAMTNLR